MNIPEPAEISLGNESSTPFCLICFSFVCGQRRLKMVEVYGSVASATSVLQ